MPEEDVLLWVIREGLSPDFFNEYRALVDRMKARQITAEEHEQLLRLNDQLERFAVIRLEALIQLARLRQVTLDDLMHDLGIGPPPDWND